MIRTFFGFELRQQLRSPLLWVITLLFGLLAFGATTSDAVQMSGGSGNVWRNAPTVIATLMTIFTLIGMLIITIFISSSVLRDFEVGIADLFFSSPIRKRDYLAGRLGAALVTSLLVYLAIATGMFIGPLMPWVDPARLGPVSLTPYLWTLAVFVIPNLLLTGALLALLAVTTRGILWVYIGVIGFFILYGVSSSLLGNLDNVWLATVLEPLGINALQRTIRYWSADERNHGLPAIAGHLLVNRALWIAVALALFGATLVLFKTERTGTARRRWGRKARSTAAVAADRVVGPIAAPTAPQVTPVFTAATPWRQMLLQVRFDARGVFRSAPFLVLLVLGLANFISIALNSEAMFGTTVLPVTSRMLAAMDQSYGLMLLIIVLFYAGELVWKERSSRVDALTDTMPVPNWVPLLAKFATLIAVVLVFQLAGALAAMLVQLAKGYTQFEPLLYLKGLTVNSGTYVLMAGMALALQVFSNNKFIGYGLLIVVMIGQIVLGTMGYDHYLYNFGRWPDAPYSDMNGYGHFLSAQLWFKSYWGLFLLSLLLLAAAFWVRGVGGDWRERFTQTRARLHGKLLAAFVLSLLAFVATGSFLYWNTNIRNRYLSPDQELDLQARYEREYGKYRNLPQPKILASSSEIDLRPETQSLRVTGTYRVHNPHVVAIGEVHIRVPEDGALVSIDFGGATLIKQDAPLGYRIYRLARPLQPGEQREIRFQLDYRPNGLSVGKPQTQIVGNGSFFNSGLFPSIGYDRGGEIGDRNDRRKRGLGEPTRMPKLEDQAARANNILTDDGDWIDFSTTICTAPDQIALAPGYLQREFTRDGRRCFSYAMDRPMLNFYAFLSARWKVKNGEYKGIPIEIYYDPKHPYNVDRMIEAVQKSLAYYEANFSPYQHKQVRIIEFPGYSSFAQSFANTIPYSESIGFIADLRDREAIDYVFYVTAHEVAHQWWGHQLIGANMQGSAMLMESLSQYSALMVMEKEYGRAKMRRFLKYELDRYLSNRGSEATEELPLYRVEEQNYIFYAKGSLVFYRLREEIGEEALNRALHKYLKQNAYQQPPYTTSAELLAFIRAEARPDQQGLITDLFEKISFYDNRVQMAVSKKRTDGKYDVTLNLHAAKVYVDGKGKESAGKLDDWVEIGVFARGPSGGESDEKVLYLQRHRITTTSPIVTVTVNGMPYEAGFDPYNKLIDRVSSDNRVRVSF
ncbi:M1 family aminopeptidase [Lysobacter firmicutimachus]|uniref:M1 family aminopeptidase n=1 Tax=Lysobacter firmicutimachus TaxID=1792846 RepID=A0AAU8MUJ1_9GAMM